MITCSCVFDLNFGRAQQVSTDSGTPIYGANVSPVVEKLFAEGLDYLALQQRDDGSWLSQSTYGSGTTGVTSICTLAFLSRGDDPNFGTYAVQIRRGIRYVILNQNLVSGTFKGNTYDFAFSMLLLAEAYGAVDDELLWSDFVKKENRRSIGDALELAVRGAILHKSAKVLRSTSWYSTSCRSSEGIPDTSVAGSLLIGLLAARNAGIKVPDHTIDIAFKYLESMTLSNGEVKYYRKESGGSLGRSALTSLCFSIGKRKDVATYKLYRSFLVARLEEDPKNDPLYARYYMAQALFQCDQTSWKKWNAMMIRKTNAIRNENGSIGRSRIGDNYATAMSLLTLALNYRLLPIYER